MKRYMVFNYDRDHTWGGMNDFSFSTNSVVMLTKCVQDLYTKNKLQGYIHVIDLHTDKVTSSMKILTYDSNLRRNMLDTKILSELIDNLECSKKLNTLENKVKVSSVIKPKEIVIDKEVVYPFASNYENKYDEDEF